MNRRSCPSTCAKRVATGVTNWRPIVVIVLLLLAGLVAESQADPQTIPRADEPLKQLSLADLGNVEVTTTSKEPEAVWKTPAAVFVITQEDIRRSGARNIPEVLRLAPGVEVAQVDSDHWSVGIRGFGAVIASKLLVLIDGRSVYTPLFAGVYWQVQATPLEDIERIEVIRGPGGTIWGANAVDGVINIITKSAQRYSGVDAVPGRRQCRAGYRRLPIRGRERSGFQLPHLRHGLYSWSPVPF